MTKNKKKLICGIEKILTLSMYDLGTHHYDSKGKGHPSFLESLNPISTMIGQLVKQGVPLGSKIKVVMKVKK